MLAIKENKKLILHMPKCAGSSIRWAVVEKYTYQWSCEHAPILKVPNMYKFYKRVGFCRNPMTWYQSKYNQGLTAFQRNGFEPTGLMCLITQNFTLNFMQALPIMLDFENFMSKPLNIKLFKKRMQSLQMNNYNCRNAMMYEDINAIDQNTFKGSLYGFYYNMIGLNTATVYKIDDGKLSEYVHREFPLVDSIHRRNTGKYERFTSNIISDVDDYYIKLNNY